MSLCVSSGCRPSQLPHYKGSSQDISVSMDPLPFLVSFTKSINGSIGTQSGKRRRKDAIGRVWQGSPCEWMSRLIYSIVQRLGSSHFSGSKMLSSTIIYFNEDAELCGVTRWMSIMGRRNTVLNT
jgi:hypothetical protein